MKRTAGFKMCCITKVLMPLMGGLRATEAEEMDDLPVISMLMKY